MSNLDYMFFAMLAITWLSAFALSSAVQVFVKRTPLSILMQSVSKPANIALWCLAAFMSLLIVRNYFLPNLNLQTLQIGLHVTLVIIAQWAAWRFIKKFEQHTTSLDKTTVIALARLAKIASLIVGTIMLMYAINVDVRALLAVGSAGTIVVGIAARDVLANFFGGFMLFIDRPFSVGDMIKTDDKGIEGVVQYIGWRHTQLLTTNQCPLYIPNSLFLSMGIQNASRAKHQCIDVTMVLKDKDINQINKILSAIEVLLRRHPEIARNMPIVASLQSFDSQGFNIRVYCFTHGYDPIRHARIQQEIFTKIAQIVEQSTNNILEPQIFDLSK